MRRSVASLVVDSPWRCVVIGLMMLAAPACNDKKPARSAAPSEVASGRPSSTPDTPAAPAPALATLRDSGCDIAIEELLSADVFRGHPPSRRREDSLANDPERAREYEKESFSDRYLACTYRVRLGATRYRYLHTRRAGPDADSLEPEMCARTAEAAAAAASIRSASDGCRDLARAAYYDVILEPLVDAPR